MKLLNRIVLKVLPTTVYDFLWRRTHYHVYSIRFDEAIRHFVLDKGITDIDIVKKYRRKLVQAFVRDNWYPDEFFFFQYERLSREGIHEFVPNREAARFWNSLNSKDIYLLTCDKGQTYQFFKPFFKRDLLSFSDETTDSISSFTAFIEKHPSFIVKPTFGNYGNGVKIIKVDRSNVLSQSLFHELISEYPKGFTVEELIKQCSELAAFHPSSVNTVRLTTVRQNNGEIYIIHRPFIRLGQGGRCVDNGGNGGIIASIDYETGIISGAIDERMNRYVVHPDSGKTILGYHIPHWENAKSFVVKLARVLPDLNYCGWDLALTDEGWVMVEANGKGLFIGFQMPTQMGFHDEFEEIKKMCNL